MVNLIKSGLDGVRTLAIGDGANDVAMIQAAHIGVGIKGEEGLQAVNSSDYAIAQFRFLSELMLKHGRYNYIRMSNSVCYIFYKNILMSIAQFWFNFSCAFSGQKYYTEGAIQMFNFLYTNFPLLLMGVYDTDILPSSAHKYPQIYLSGINDEYFKASCALLVACIAAAVYSIDICYSLFSVYVSSTHHHHHIHLTSLLLPTSRWCSGAGSSTRWWSPPSSPRCRSSRWRSRAAAAPASPS